jgi:hypothetical protein
MIANEIHYLLNGKERGFGFLGKEATRLIRPQKPKHGKPTEQREK